MKYVFVNYFRAIYMVVLIKRFVHFQKLEKKWQRLKIHMFIDLYNSFKKNGIEINFIFSSFISIKNYLIVIHEDFYNLSEVFYNFLII